MSEIKKRINNNHQAGMSYRMIEVEVDSDPASSNEFSSSAKLLWSHTIQISGINLN